MKTKENEQLHKEKKNCVKIWWCGPPNMNILTKYF